MLKKILYILGGLLILAGIVWYILWSFFLNYGFVTFVGDVEYSITLDGETSECSKVCEFQVTSGSHSYALSHEGYRGEGGIVTVERWNREFVKVDLTYIPKVGAPQEYTIFQLPVGYGNYDEALRGISLFNTFDKDFVLKKLPKKLDNMVFSDNGKRALVFSDGAISTYLVDESLISRINGFEGAFNADFTHDGDEFYTISYDDNVKKYVLRRVNFKNGTYSDMVFFNRNVTDYDLRVSPNQKYVILVDKTFVPSVMYLIDLENSTRTNVYEGNSIRLGNFSTDDNYFVFEARNITQDFPNLKYLDASTQTISEFMFKANVEQFGFTKDGYGYFITDSEMGDFEVTVADLFSEVAEPSMLKLNKWNPLLDEVNTVLELEEFFEGRPSRIEVSEDSKLIRFLLGEKLYDLKITD